MGCLLPLEQELPLISPLLPTQGSDLHRRKAPPLPSTEAPLSEDPLVWTCALLAETF